MSRQETQGIFTPAELAEIRAIARGEVASLIGLVLRRTQEVGDDASAKRVLASTFGEALNDFTTDTEPGT